MQDGAAGRTKRSAWVGTVSFPPGAISYIRTAKSRDLSPLHGRRAALEAFHRLPPSFLERTERLEQLRFLENGIDITVVETTEPTIGVDTEEDLRAVAAQLGVPLS